MIIHMCFIYSLLEIICCDMERGNNILPLSIPYSVHFSTRESAIDKDNAIVATNDIKNYM
jgi:hypothetical protein